MDFYFRQLFDLLTLDFFFFAIKFWRYFFNRRNFTNLAHELRIKTRLHETIFSKSLH
jgi:hypothetical protein